MATLPKFVPMAVVTFYSALAQGNRSYTDKERACWCRLVTDQRMREVYDALQLDDQGWRLFFDLAWNHAFLDHKLLRKKRRRAYELLKNVSKHAGALADALEGLEPNAIELGEATLYHIDLTPLENMLELLKTASPNRAMFDTYVQPNLDRIGDLARLQGVPTPANLVRAIANLAEEIDRLRSFPGGELQSGNPIVATAAAGRSSSSLAAYRRTFLEACRYHDELRPLDQFSDAAMASLASVALNEHFTEEAVKKLRVRDISR